MSKNFITRTITAICFLVIMVGSIMLGRIYYAAVMYFVLVASIYELSKLIKIKDPNFSLVSSLILGSATYLIIALVAFKIISSSALILLVVIAFSAILIELFRKKTDPIINVSTALFSIIYTAIPLALSLFLFTDIGETVFEKRILILGYFFIIWVYDTGAYIVGSIFGKNKVDVEISPLKTWEGCLGGAFFAIITALILSKYFSILNTCQWIILSIIISITAVMGDFLESLFKRSVNVKDSGKLLPGHGGVLDRFDSTLMSMPFVFCYLFFILYY